MLDTIKQFLKEHEIDEKAGFIIAVSGGADSITLLHAFKYLNLRIHALHCNFNLRGKESNSLRRKPAPASVGGSSRTETRDGG